LNRSINILKASRRGLAASWGSLLRGLLRLLRLLLLRDLLYRYLGHSGLTSEAWPIGLTWKVGLRGI